MDRSTAGLRQYYVAVGEAGAKLTTLVELLQALRVDSRLALAIACSSRDSVDAVAHALTTCKGFNIAILHADLELHDMEQQIMQLKRKLQPQQAASIAEESAAAAAAAALQPPADPQQQQGQVQQPQQQQQQQALAQAANGIHRPDPIPAAATAASHSSSTTAAAVQLSQEDDRSLALVASDVVLKNLSKDMLPLGLPLLLQYDLPPSKEVLQRRLAAVFGSSKERGRRIGRQVVIDFVTAGDVAGFRARERMSSAPVLEMPVHVPDIFC